MDKTHVLAAFLAAVSHTSLVVPAVAQDASELELSANAALVSDYRFRGLSLSDEDFAIQGGLDASLSGFNVGFWGSSIEQFNGSELELDVYGGYTFDLGEAALGVGAIAYLFPGGTDTDYVEIYASLGFALADLETTVGANYAPEQDNIGDDDNIYIFADLGYAVPDTPFGLSGHIGFEDGAFGDEKIDWSLGATLGYKQLELGVQYVDTDDFDAAVVFSVGASF